MGPGVLSDILSKLPKIRDERVLVGFDSSDDACVYKVSDDVAIINSIDFFPPIVDDPYMFGQIAAANSLSDIYAMGGTPKLAMNLLTFPEKLPLAAVEAILEGGNDKVNEAGAMTTGGHSINDKEPKYGLSVTGFAHPDDILSNSASEGDYLVITKKIGSGVLTSADKVDFLNKSESDELSRTMAELNKYAFEATAGVKVDGCTDITGFGLLGHGAEMARAGDVTLEVFTERIPLMSRALEFAAQGILPAGAHNNMAFLSEDVMDYSVGLKQEQIDMLYDPQTSGGLLLAVKEPELERLQYQLREKGCENAVIGRFKKRTSHYIEILNK
ncbi:selenide, water dikinase SelD [Mogibacterium timidum]|uniref:selenide, water dikinase SelD n=1 Tax=Mogibacterium timidum TaxID=35519 RepID=UPI002ED2D028